MNEITTRSDSQSERKPFPGWAKLPPKQAPEPDNQTQTNEEILASLFSMLREVAQQMQNLEEFLEQLPVKKEPKSLGQVGYETFFQGAITGLTWETVSLVTRTRWQETAKAILQHHTTHQ